MEFTSHINRRLVALFFLLLSIFSVVTATALPQTENITDVTNEPTLIARVPGVGNSIDQAEYEAYLRRYYPGGTGKWLLYTGNAESQLQEFQRQNTGYLYYDDFYNADKPGCHWYDQWPRDQAREDDSEEASAAIAALITGDVLVFGGVEWRTAGSSSHFTSKEIPGLRTGLATGRIRSVKHMVKDATRPDQILATQDLPANPANDRVNYMPGYAQGTKNSGPRGQACSKRDGSCSNSSGAPPVTCPAGQAKFGSEGDCWKCRQNMKPSKDKKTCRQQCDKNQARTGKDGACEKCPTGKVQSDDGYSCVDDKKCAAGEAKTGPNGECQKCPTPKVPSSDGNTCVDDNKQCGTGEAKTGPNGECQKCPSGKIPAGDGKSCVNDPKNDDKDKDKKSARTKWCLGFVAGSGLIGGAESLRTPEGMQALSDAGNTWPSDANFGNLDYALGDSNMNIDLDKSATVPEDWLKSKRDLSGLPKRDISTLSRRQGIISAIRLAGALARVAEAVTNAAKAAAQAAVEASRFVGQTGLRVGGKGRAGEADAGKLADLNKISSADKARKASDDLTKVKGTNEFRDCLAMAIPAGGMILADAAMHKDGVPDGGFKSEPDPLALVVFKNEDDDRDKGSSDAHGPSHYWVTYNDALWHDNRIIAGTCQSAAELSGQISAYAVNGGCCAFYADDKCTSPVFMATNREDMNLKGSANDHIGSWSCTKDLGCAGVPNWKNYAKGQCGLHITQYQSDLGANPIAFEVSIKDDLDQEIFHEARTNTAGDLLSFHVDKMNIDVKFDISAAARSADKKGSADDNAKITVGTDTFWSGSKGAPEPRCNFGTYDGSGGHPGKRQGDCGFAC